MEWNKYTIKTKTTVEDMICGMLIEEGINGFEIEDKVPLSKEDKEAMYIDILPDLGEDDGISYISFYLDKDDDNEKIILNVKTALENLRNFADIGEGTIISSITKQEDWVNNWKEFFKPFTVDDIIIKPTWEKLTEDIKGRTIIDIDPGTAFGTGQHETTKLCIKQLKKYVDNHKKVLDVGCGSGILSIVALKLGAKEIFGTDIDIAAVNAANENIAVNHLENEKYKFISGNIIDDEEVQKEAGIEIYDIVVANILADVIIPLSAGVSKHLKKGGVFISSGIINTKADEVREAITKNRLTIIEETHMKDWVSFTAQRS